MTDADRSQDLGETIDILEAQVERLELELCYEDREPKQLTLTQAEELAKSFLAAEKPLKDALVELLTTIHNTPVKLDDLAQIDRFCFTNSGIEVKDAA